MNIALTTKPRARLGVDRSVLGVSHPVARAVASVWMAVVVASALVSPVAAQLGDSCAVSAFNRTAPVDHEGAWLLPGVPSNLGESNREGLRTPPVAREEIASALHGEGDPESLAPALTSADNKQASAAAAALLTHYGCAAVEGLLREALIHQARSFPTPEGVVLLGCLRGDQEALEVLRSFKPTAVHLGWFGSPFSDWESIRSFALAEAGDQDARDALKSQLEADDHELTTTLLHQRVFPYVQDRQLLLALSKSILDSRLMRPGGPTYSDLPNPEISVVAAHAFASRFGVKTARSEERRPRPFTEAEKRMVYEEVQRVLRGLEESERLPQKRLPARVLQ